MNNSIAELTGRLRSMKWLSSADCRNKKTLNGGSRCYIWRRVRDSFKTFLSLYFSYLFNISILVNPYLNPLEQKSRKILLKLALTGLVAASSGCGESHNIENSTDFVKWSGNITEQSPHFILSYDSKKYPDPQIERVEQWWVGIQTCTGVSIDITDKPLIIEYVTTDKLPPSDSGLGYYLGFIDIDQRFVSFTKWT